jgi:hypothetical protein
MPAESALLVGYGIWDIDRVMWRRRSIGHHNGMDNCVQTGDINGDPVHELASALGDGNVVLGVP